VINIRNEIIVVMDSVGWDTLKLAIDDMPFLSSLNPQKAYSFGTFTFPSMAAIVNGFVPKPNDKDPPMKHISLHLPVTDYFKSEGGYNFCISGNPLWSIFNAAHWFDDFFYVSYPGPDAHDDGPRFRIEQTRDSLKKYRQIIKPDQAKKPIFGVILLMETHHHNVSPGVNHYDVTSKKILPSMDGFLKLFYDHAPPDTRVIFTSDHGDLHPELHGRIGHDPRGSMTRDERGYLLEVFYAEKIK
jgi:hypothetical protein